MGKRGPQKGAPNAGRPEGTGATFVRVEERASETGTGAARVFIGRARWQAMGQPARVSIYRRGGFVCIRPSHSESSYAIVGPASNSIPRISVGEATLVRLGLMAGIYETRMSAYFCMIDLASFVPAEPDPVFIRRITIKHHAAVKLCQSCGRQMVGKVATRKTCADCQSQEAQKRLSDRESRQQQLVVRNRVITERHRNGETLEKIGAAYGISRQRVQQICLDEERRTSESGAYAA